MTSHSLLLNKMAEKGEAAGVMKVVPRMVYIIIMHTTVVSIPEEAEKAARTGCIRMAMTRLLQMLVRMKPAGRVEAEHDDQTDD